MFYFTCNESRIYESFNFWNKLQKKELFHDILIFWDAPVYVCIYIYIYIYIYSIYTVYIYIYTVYIYIYIYIYIQINNKYFNI